MGATTAQVAGERQATRRVTLNVFGTTCRGCAQHVQENLMTLEGVHSVSVDLDAQLAEVDVDATDAATEFRIEKKMVSMGYTVQPAVLPSCGAPGREERELSPAPPPLRPSAASLSHLSSFASVSTCCTSQLQRSSETSKSTETSSLREGGGFLPFSRRFRRVPCGCGGRGCLCAYAPEPVMVTEETRLLPEDDSEECLSERAEVPSSVDITVATVQACASPRRRAPVGVRATSTTATAAAAAATTNLLIEGMSCTSCAARIEAKLKQLKGVLGASVNFSAMSGQVLHNPALAPLPKVVSCVADMSYIVTAQDTTAPLGTADGEQPQEGECKCPTNLQAVPVHVGSVMSGYEHRLVVLGMSCASCAARIEHRLRQMPTVLNCTVSFVTGTAVITTCTPSGFTDACRMVRSMGYTVTETALMQPDSSISRTREALERAREIAEHERNLIGSALLSVPLAVVMVLTVFMDIMARPLLARMIDGMQFCAVTPIVFHFGRGFFLSAWRSWQHGAYTMDTLVAIGTGCTYAYSTVVYLLTLFVYPHARMMTYFDTAGMLTTFMLLGRFLEARAKRSASRAVIELMSLMPTTAVCVQPDGSEVRVSASQLQKGALVRVLAGDRVPVDGTIVEGSSELDEQMVTGESLSKQKKPGEEVVGGTLNITASLLIRADKVGEETMIAQVLRIVQEAQNTKPSIQRAADRIAMSFVPFVLVFSLLTLSLWLMLGVTDAYPVSWRGAETSWQAFAFNFFISTVVAACPCALGLATPTAIMVGTGVGAKNGVLVKSGTTLEEVRRVNCVVLDKTGTITNGRLEVIRTHMIMTGLASPPTTTAQPHGSSDAALVRCLVGLVEAQSNHPIAKAVSAKLLAENDRGTDEVQRRARYGVSSVVTHGGKGVEASVAVTPASGGKDEVSSEPPPPRAHHVLVGNVALLREHGVSLTPEVAHLVEEENGHGLTTVVAAVDGAACLVVSLADSPKREAHGVIRYLHKAGIRVLMVTGDNAGVAGRIAAEVGIHSKDVYAEALPIAKAGIVKGLQEQGLRVMFVGDGINDSPALAQANVGVALGAGTEVAIEAADAVLVRDSLVDLLNLQSLSKVTVQRIYGNFIWAFGYNLLMLPAASGLLYPFFHIRLPPVVAGAAMMLSSLSVLTSSLTIRCLRAHCERDFYFM
ncbi:putative copper-transporting ATPase-like protein [Leishmania major strain Friedlin]|uniref:Copper-transporting ATPase n=1 Tax=Leishmania major TaxID=5664 RepID=Q4Q3X8_LEIMA|nr:putative copper-transporting ATPase-like protein [Leishmania major strain Friedlin]QRZ20886.1 copper-transporting ATPase [Leishmania major]QRZ20887.1 copper-transporting ATPase [Leishmania major]CAG9580800.1 copper-transporting_ATPase-like_protein_-_putative [Leishmania major strain Friedlin]CAJ06550.1 putative copper-transporting ATPase-like protein [Leishmania major strain Friedlin]|eukprot:XP_001685970.1 putative copper-transporting ATPase-like protein [Leishmania major strain Friedlin]